MSTIDKRWKEFGDVSVDENDKILTPFMHFNIGTDKFEVWEYFDENSEKGIHDLMFGGE